MVLKRLGIADCLGRICVVRNLRVIGLTRRKASTEPVPPTKVPPRWRSYRRLSRHPLTIQSIVSILVVGGASAFVVAQVRPDLLFAPTLDVGGDNAAHVVASYYLIHDLLPRFQLSGWDPQWFNGFPLYVFYFPLPALFVAFLSWFSPFAVAFKLVTVLGSVTMPFGAYVFGRGAGLRRPVPELMSVATLPFLFNVSYTIDGGNLASTMAGEFSYSLALTLGLFFLGAFAFALRTGRQRWLAAVLFGAMALCHVVPALFIGGVAILFAASFHNRRALHVLMPVGVTGGLLIAFWLVPFGADLRYSSSMGYTRVTDVFGQIFPLNGELFLPVFALIGVMFGVTYRDRIIGALGASAVGVVVAFQFAPNGLVYNARWLPFWFFATALLAAYGVACLGSLLFSRLQLTSWHVVFTPIISCAIVVALIAAWLGVLPVGNWPVAERNFTDSWISWNYSGYQRKQGWPEYQRIVAMLDSVTKTNGCGRLDYEYSPNVQNDFGSTLVEMAFPLFTNGCIQSAEGLYYESSTSTPFHFLDQAELSIQASNPVVGIPYQMLNVADGIRHLQLQGIRYFLANSPTVEREAAKDPELVELASTPATPSIVDGAATPSTTPSKLATKWIVYAIKSSPLVTGLTYEPVVEANLSKDAWLNLAIDWYQHESYWPVPVVGSGLTGWIHLLSASLVSPQAAVPVDPTVVSDVSETNESIAFRVSRIGTPVLVKIPYFPNWQASGAYGPFDATPNFMVVVPTSHSVVLSYQATGIDIASKFASGLGFLGVLGLIWSDRRMRNRLGSDETDDPLPEGKPVDGVEQESVEPGSDDPKAGQTTLSEPT